MGQKEPKGLPKMLTTQEVLDILKVGRKALYRYIKDGELKAYKIGRYLRFKESDVKAFIEAHKKFTGLK